MIVMETICREFTEALPWELLYVGDLVVMAVSKDEVTRKLNLWKEGMSSKCLKVNVNNKTRVMISGESCKGVQITGWPCGVCGSAVERNSVQYVTNRCSGSEV